MLPKNLLVVYIPKNIIDYDHFNVPRCRIALCINRYPTSMIERCILNAKSYNNHNQGLYIDMHKDSFYMCEINNKHKPPIILFKVIINDF